MLLDESLFEDIELKENIDYIKWVQLPSGKWKIWGSNLSSELDPEFLDRARKFNKVDYLDAKVSKNGEYPEGVSEEDVEENHRFVKESIVAADNTEIIEAVEDEEKPYSKEEVERELKSITNNWTRKYGDIKVYYDEELKHAKDLLSDHYEHVETSSGPQGWKVVAYRTSKKED